MSSKRPIAVLRATGVQGGSVSDISPPKKQKAIFNPDRYNIGCLTPLDTAQFNDPASLVKAFEGVEAVYTLTNFYNPENQSNPLAEAQQEIAIADAAKAVGVGFVIWSTVPSSILRTNAQCAFAHVVENKFYVSVYLKKIKIPHVEMYLGCYYDNWPNFKFLSIAADGVIEVTQPVTRPGTKIGMIWTERDLRPAVDAILKNYRTKPLASGEVYCVGGYHSTADVAEEVQRQTGKQTRVVTTPTSGFKDLDLMYEYYNDHRLYSEFPIPEKETLGLGIEFHSMEDFAKRL
ncbi:uncharacterized protein Z519_04656 [Cladophialophora bantiana CBS 173.52]|uniref:NmrA-like domain-containing protein n=1 Tax=Cladophialophora bantiana (strain ATCC 10958 / CBS 173.52 / CDC B-1940 / NIH 8579) TaxID=1442370 RepID=A0A0D2ID47_CLAB1|nr:uncharacterized protein Z519_04656 [Cladophialophora bantiana CBS 173.52]KIW94679.1 hypothetical protein Z519_04656 [Cladophialophora bantiana CBS 173.52]